MPPKRPAEALRGPGPGGVRWRRRQRSAGDVADVAHWSIVAAIVVLASAMQGLTGFGFAILATPLLALVKDPHEAVGLCVVLSTLSALGMWWHTRREEKLPINLRLFSAAMFGLPVGMLALGILEDSFLRLGAGLATLAFATIIAFSKYRPGPNPAATVRPTRVASQGATVSAGLASGFLTGCLSMPGPPVVALLTSWDVSKSTYRATLLAYFALVYPVALVAMAMTGLIRLHDIGAALTHVPALVLGSWLGNAGHERVPETVFVALSLLLLTATGIACIGTATNGFLAIPLR